MPQTILSDRAVLSLTGEDRITLLQGLVTVDLDRLETSPHVFGALLAPQGKIQFDFFLHKRDHAILIDMNASRAADFLKRMKMYKLRAKADITDVTDQYDVAVSWGDTTPSENVDARYEALGTREVLESGPEQTASDDEYHAHRVALGVPEAGKDFAFDDIFPHDAMMDALGGVDFRKGCYVGQEVVSRVQHRSTARKRFFILKSAAPLKSDEPVMLGDKSVGTTGTTFGNSTMALLRADKLDGATDLLTVDGQSAEALVPSYFTDFQNKKA